MIATHYLPNGSRQLNRIGTMLLVGCVWLGGALHSLAAESKDPLNVIVILIDDLGHADLHCSGSRIYETPCVDRLAAEGMLFTHAYSACPVCSPTRAALLTGCYPARLHITDWIPGWGRPRAKLRIPDWTQHLPLEEVTVAEMLKAAGYATAMIGKWHLGGQGYEPLRQGFDVAIAGDGRGHPPTYFSPYDLPNLPDGPRGEYLTDRLTDEAVKFIDAHQRQPFFLYLSHYAVHTPIQPPEDLNRHYEEKLGYAPAGDNLAGKPTAGKQDNPGYAAMVDNMSQSVDNVLRKLEATGLAARTLVIFTSDNGGEMEVETKTGKVGITGNQPARAGKGSEYEGGVRVPLIVRWPGEIQPGSTSDAPAMTIDLLPTILSATGVSKGNVQLDGLDLMPLLKQQAASLARPLYWHYPHYAPQGAKPFGAVRQGDYRLVEFYEDNRVELYNLKDDVGEQRDLAGSEPERATRLRKQLAEWRTAVGAQMPAPNPAYGAARPQPK